MKTALSLTCLLALLAFAACAKMDETKSKKARCKPVAYEGNCKQGYNNDHGAVCMNKFAEWNNPDLTAPSLIWSTSTVLTGKKRPHWPRTSDRAAFYVSYKDDTEFYWCKWEDDDEIEDTERDDKSWMNMLCEDKGSVDNGRYWYNYYFYTMYSNDNPNADVYRSYARNDKYQVTGGWQNANDDEFFMVQYNVSTRLYYCVKREWIAPKRETFRARCEYKPCGAGCQANAYQSNGTHHCLQGCWVPRESEWQDVDYQKVAMGPVPPGNPVPKTYQVVTNDTAMFVKFNTTTWVYWCDKTPQPACVNEAPLMYGDDTMTVDCKRVSKDLGWYQIDGRYYQIEDVQGQGGHDTFLYRNETALVPGRFMDLGGDQTFYMMKYNLTTVLYRCDRVPETPLCTTTEAPVVTTTRELTTASEATTLTVIYNATTSLNESTTTSGNETETEEGGVAQRLVGGESGLNATDKPLTKPHCSKTIIYTLLIGLACILIAALIWDLGCRDCKTACGKKPKPAATEADAAAVPLRAATAAADSSL